MIKINQRKSELKMTKKMLIPFYLTFFLAGCANNSDDLSQWMNSEGKKLVGQVSPLPAVAPFIPIPYIGKELPDPFGPKKSTKISSNAPDNKRKKEFLETFPLDRLTLVGSILKKGTLWGMVKTPDNTISLVKAGDYLGQNFGKITSINESELVIKESVLDPQGDWIDREVNLHALNSK